MRRLSSALLMVLVLSTGNLQPVSADDSTTHISPDELLAEIQSGTAPAIVDVRSDSEYATSHVPGAIHIPFYAVFARRSEIPTSASERVIVYCEHGPRAGIAKLQLRAAGFEHVLYLEGHMSRWKQRGLPVDAGGQ
jgi:rhodanese-related sulfurtransferase